MGTILFYMNYYFLFLFFFSGKSITLLGKIKLAARLHRPHMFIGYPSNSTEIQRKPASLRALWWWMLGKQKWMDCWWSLCVYERLICTLYPLRESTGIEGFQDETKKQNSLLQVTSFSNYTNMSCSHFTQKSRGKIKKAFFRTTILHIFCIYLFIFFVHCDVIFLTVNHPPKFSLQWFIFY